MNNITLPYMLWDLAYQYSDLVWKLQEAGVTDVKILPATEWHMKMYNLDYEAWIENEALH